MTPDAGIDGIPGEIGTASVVEDIRHSDDGTYDRETTKGEHTDNDDFIAFSHLEA